MKRTLKFRKHLVPLILSGEKTVTWRLFDDKNLAIGDEIDLVNWDNKKIFGEGVLTEIREKALGDIEETDFAGHENYESEEKMYKAYREYYGDKVDKNTIVKMIKFKLIE